MSQWDAEKLSGVFAVQLLLPFGISCGERQNVLMFRFHTYYVKSSPPAAAATVLSQMGKHDQIPASATVNGFCCIFFDDKVWMWKFVRAEAGI